MVDWVCKHSEEKDLSIWEVRGQPKHFTYSQIMVRPRALFVKLPMRSG